MTPVPVITGVVNSKCGLREPGEPFFDWYAASFPGVGPDEFLGSFLNKNDLAKVVPYQGKTHGYEGGARVLLGDLVLLSVLWGGNRGAPLNAWASGGRSPAFAGWARSDFPNHYVTRVDAAIDLNAPGAWDDLLDLFFDLRNAFPRVQSSVLGDLYGGKKGVTHYLGSVKSESRMRLYQKGLQVPEAGQPYHVRAEFMVKPKGAQRLVLAKSPPSQVWTYSPVARMAFDRLKGFDPGVAVRDTPRRTDLQRRFDAMCKQYGKTIAEVVSLLGSPEALGLALLSGELPSLPNQEG